LTDEKALTVWSWIIDKNHPLEGAVAVNDDDTMIGFAHYREVPRTLTADRGLFLDDLFVAEDARHTGAGRALIEFTKDFARQKKLTQVQLVTAKDNSTAQKLYDQVGTKTDWVTYEIEL
jgi:ribosomal protein S18 acetylase RimI-like enzyme